MNKMFTGSSILLSLMLVGAGCSASQQVAVTPGALVPAQQAAETGLSLEGLRAKLSAAGLAFTESDQAGDVAKMKSSASISNATKFKFSEGNGSVRLLVITAKDSAQLAVVKAEVEAQYATLQTLSTSVRIQWLPGDATHMLAVNFKAGDEAAAQKLADALK